MNFAKTYHSLRTLVSEIQRQHALPDDATAFAYWFSQALLANPDDTKEIKESLVGGKDDRNVDILLVNRTAKMVFVCQTKYHRTLMKTSEAPNEVHAHANIARAFAGSEAELNTAVKNVKKDARFLLTDAWKLIRESGYSLRLIYATTGKISRNVREEATDIVESVRLPAERAPDFEFLVYDGNDCCRLYVDYQDMVPSIPYVDFDGVDSRFRIEDTGEHLHSYVFPLPATTLKRIYDTHRERLFARNIRLWKGLTGTNEQIEESLLKNPHEFFYLNNGVTILATNMELRGEGHGGRLRVYGPQIINGQQTTRTIARQGGLLSRAHVLVKVIAKGATGDDEVDELRGFVRRVVRATNFQNKVSLSELAANNPEHVNLDRAFKTRDWRYIRKRGTADDGDSVDEKGLAKSVQEVTFQELTTALVVCRHDPQFIRKFGVEGLFEEKSRRLYDKLYPRDLYVDDCIFCVLCYYLALNRRAKARSWKRTVENYGVYYIAYRLYCLLRPLYGRDPKGVLDCLGARSKKIRYSSELNRLRTVIGKVWFEFVTDGIAQDQDVGAFVREDASRDRWDRYWESRKNRERNDVHMLLDGILG